MNTNLPIHMVALWLFLFVTCCLANDNEICWTVKKGYHHAWKNPFDGFRDASEIPFKAKFAPNCAKYLFPPTEPSGPRCQHGWNKLYGASRCGYLNHHHRDSDRFVWRRHPSCIKIENGRVVGEVENCSHKDKIQVAAYAYDKNRKPFQNPDLLTPFKNLLDLDKYYSFKIVDERTKTHYYLYDEQNNLIEKNTILHSICPSPFTGYYLAIYFGGYCPAPQDVSICYKGI